MLDEKDLQMLQTMMKTVVDESAKETRTMLIGETDKRIAKSENRILDELDRTRSILEDQIAAVKKNMDELSQYYRVTKLENDNTALLLRIIENLEKRVSDLEKKTA